MLKKGFGFVEFIIILLILGILAVVAIVQSSNLVNFSPILAAHKIKSDIRYAQSYALTSQKRTMISFDVNLETYTLYYEDTPGSWVVMTNPLDKNNFMVDFTEQTFRGIDIISTDFDGSNYGLVFDAEGIPYSYNFFDGSAFALSNEGSVALSGGISVRIEPNTGKVSI